MDVLSNASAKMRKFLLGLLIYDTPQYPRMITRIKTNFNTMGSILSDLLHVSDEYSNFLDDKSTFFKKTKTPNENMRALNLLFTDWGRSVMLTGYMYLVKFGETPLNLYPIVS